VQAALLVATTAAPEAVQELSMNVAHLVTLVLQDLDDVSRVHSAAVHEGSDVNAKGLLAAAEAVQQNSGQFLQFQHHPLGGAALPDASATQDAAVGALCCAHASHACMSHWIVSLFLCFVFHAARFLIFALSIEDLSLGNRNQEGVHACRRLVELGGCL
jgi:hypothetical protein